MKTAALRQVLERVESWPPDAQDELAEIALDIEPALSGKDYNSTAEEIAGIDRGLRAAEAGRFATEVEAVLTKLRR